MEIAGKLVSGDPANDATEVGPLISKSEADRVEAWIKEAVAGGARLIAGGERKGSMIAPTILTGTKPGMKIRDEEAFGPVVVVEPYLDLKRLWQR